MKSRRVLITGGAGLVGSHIADLLVKQDAGEIIVVDNLSRGCLANLSWAVKHGNVTVVEGDIRDRRLLLEAMQGIDTVFHQAAIRITQCAEEPRLALEVLVDGTFNVLEAAVERKVRKVIAASSASVYGLADTFPTSEMHHPYHNDTFYGAAKVFNEGMLRSFRAMRGLNFVGLRYFNVYGPRMDVHGVYTEVLVRWMERIVHGKPPLIFGSGNQTMDFIFVEDCARANLLAAQTDVSDEVFNIAIGEEISLVDLARELLNVMGSDLEPEHREERTVNPVSRRLADTSKAARRLGFNPTVPLNEGLRRLVKWWQEERTTQRAASD